MVKAFQYKIKKEYLFFTTLIGYKHIRKQKRKKSKAFFRYIFKRLARRKSYNVSKFYLQNSGLWYTWKKNNINYKVNKNLYTILKSSYEKFNNLIYD